MKTQYKVRDLTVMALLCAFAYACVLIFPIRIEFLTYEPKDCILAIGGMLYGPAAALLMSVVVATVECVTVSSTGFIGLLMNVIASSLFICPAAFVYKRKRTLQGAIAGLVCGAVLMTAGMLLWNWLITPLYLGAPREQVVALLVPLILPFNFLKAAVNALLTVLLYKSVVTTLRKARLLPKRAETPVNKKTSLMVWLVGLVLFVTLLIVLFVWNGIL